MKSLSFLLPAGLALVALAACIVPPSVFERASWNQPPDWQENGRYRPEDAPRATVGGENAPEGEPVPAETPAKEAPLYAWDGGVVDGSPQGVRAAQGEPRGLEQPAPGRTHIIELYQQVLDERDGLAEEVELLRKSLEMTTVALEEETRKSNDLSARVAALEVGHRELMEDNQAIAARLVQAQIRRLEAEKMLLETRIEVEKEKEAEAAQAAAAARTPAGKSASKPKVEKPVAKDEHEGGHE
ncbi:MAG: hypothetical protein ABL998_13510 [Planctomycetota bacterium]